MSSADLVVNIYTYSPALCLDVKLSVTDSVSRWLCTNV